MEPAQDLLCPGDWWHHGEELVPSAVALTVGLGLRMLARSWEGLLVTKGGECVELLRPLVVGHVGLLHHQILGSGVGVRLEKNVMRVTPDDFVL